MAGQGSPRVHGAAEQPLTSWRDHEPFYRWCEESTEEAGDALRDLWTADDPLVGLGRLLDALPEGLIEADGGRVAVTAFLLLGVDAESFRPSGRTLSGRRTDSSSEPRRRAGRRAVHGLPRVPRRARVRLVARNRDSRPSRCAEPRLVDHQQRAARVVGRARSASATCLSRRARPGLRPRGGRRCPSVARPGREQLRREHAADMVRRGIRLDRLAERGSLRFERRPSGDPRPSPGRRTRTRRRARSSAARGSSVASSTSRRGIGSSRPTETTLLPPPPGKCRTPTPPPPPGAPPGLSGPPPPPAPGSHSPLSLRAPNTLHISPFFLLKVKVPSCSSPPFLIFYGPPGTGKTFVAQALGEHVEQPGAACELVQFHPAYTLRGLLRGLPARARRRPEGLRAGSARPTARDREAARATRPGRTCSSSTRSTAATSRRSSASCTSCSSTATRRSTSSVLAREEPFTLPRTSSSSGR